MSRETKDAAAEWPAVERRKPGWAIDWQSTVEHDKASLAQCLHDDTGGLLVAAVMDISWAETHMRGDAAAVKQRLVRARSALEAAIDLNRRIIEDLRPTLLDNFGLIAALKWHLAEACKTANITCDHQWPETSPEFSAPAAIAFYRIAQTLITLIVGHHAHSLMMELSVDQEFVTLKMKCDGLSDDLSRDDAKVNDALTSVTGRVRALGGEMRFDSPVGGALIKCRVPVSIALRN